MSINCQLSIHGDKWAFFPPVLLSLEKTRVKTTVIFWKSKLFHFWRCLLWRLYFLSALLSSHAARGWLALAVLFVCLEIHTIEEKRQRLEQLDYQVQFSVTGTSPQQVIHADWQINAKSEIFSQSNNNKNTVWQLNLCNLNQTATLLSTNKQESKQFLCHLCAMIPRRVSPWEFHLFIQNHSQVLLYNVKKTKGIFTPVGIWNIGTPGMSNLESISYLNYIISKDIKLKHLLCYSLHFLLISLIQSWNILYTCTN